VLYGFYGFQRGNCGAYLDVVADIFCQLFCLFESDVRACQPLHPLSASYLRKTVSAAAHVGCVRTCISTFLSCGASWDFTIAYDHSVVVSSPSLLDLPVSISS
jgi:hypothetical protein